MADKSKIEWTEATWNPVTGCSKVSPGCAHCYAETLSLRWRTSVLPWTPENAALNVVLHPERLEQPAKWRRPRMIFVNSMSDLFHELVPVDYVGQVFDAMQTASQHTYQVLTKRPERALEVLRELGREALPNVWMGVSIENSRFTWRADVLREVPAAVRFISAEPLLGSLLERAHGVCGSCDHSTYLHSGNGCDTEISDWGDTMCNCDRRFAAPLDLTAIDWLIAGGESGNGYRPVDVRWVRELRDACGVAGTAFFFKQWGGRTPKAGGRELDGRTHDSMPAASAVA